MHWRAIIRLFGLLLMLYSLSFLPSLAVALVYQDGQWPVFLESLAATLSAGLRLWLPNVHRESELSVRNRYSKKSAALIPARLKRLAGRTSTRLGCAPAWRGWTFVRTFRAGGDQCSPLVRSSPASRLPCFCGPPRGNS